jgi:alpha-tubulin suppressor-like RCC1 family protein
MVVGFSHACAVDKSNTVKCWGSNTQGELGDGTIEDRKTPVEVRW